jgi:hypothetical protein
VKRALIKICHFWSLKELFDNDKPLGSNLYLTWYDLLELSLIYTRMKH